MCMYVLQRAVTVSDMAMNNSGVSLIDVLQQVPLLLHACVASLGKITLNMEPSRHRMYDRAHYVREFREIDCNSYHVGIAQLRRVCKQASTAALQAVSGYAATLCPEMLQSEDTTEPLSEVAKLLRKTNLRRLRVHVQTTQGKAALGK